MLEVLVRRRTELDHRKCSHPEELVRRAVEEERHASALLAATDHGEPAGLHDRSEQLVVLAEPEVVDRRAGRERHAVELDDDAAARPLGDVTSVDARSRPRCRAARARAPASIAAFVEPDRRPGKASVAKRCARGPERAGDDEQVARTVRRPGRERAQGYGRSPSPRSSTLAAAARVAADDRRRRSRRSPRRARARRSSSVSPGSAEADDERLRRTAPLAARSQRLTAAARKPRSRQEMRSNVKWTPSTSASFVTTTPALELAPRRSRSPWRGRALELAKQPELAKVRQLHGQTALRDARPKTSTGPSPAPSSSRPSATASAAVSAAPRAASESDAPCASSAASVAECVHPAPCVAIASSRATGSGVCLP